MAAATDTTYNGWTNYPTWAVNLWISNDPGTDAAAIELVGETIVGVANLDQVSSGIWTFEQARRFMVADALKDWVAELVTDESSDEGRGMVLAGLGADLIGWTLAQVNWEEIAAGWILTVQETETNDAH